MSVLGASSNLIHLDLSSCTISFFQAAPKIDETNVGFVMLASMGWSDGATIGLSGGLDVPITAVIKKTKLGLGASTSTKI